MRVLGSLALDLSVQKEKKPWRKQRQTVSKQRWKQKERRLKKRTGTKHASTGEQVSIDGII